MNKKIIFTAALILLALTAYSFKVIWTPRFKVAVASSRTGSVDINVKADGRIEETGRTEVYSPVEGIVALTRVTEGSRVAKEDIIAELIDGTKLSAPVDGNIVLLNARVGNMVSPISPFAVIGETAKLSARVNIPEAQAAKVRTGMKANITCAAVENKTYTGMVSYISPSAKTVAAPQGSRTAVEAVIELDAAGGLKPGYSADAEILTEHRANSVIVPFDAIVQYDGKTGVWTEKAGYAYFSPVDTGAELELETEIMRGVKAGEKVIVSPPKGILNGVRVEVGG